MALPPLRPGASALITGASSGIGVGFAHALAQRGFDVGLVARRRDRLRALAEDLERAYGIAATVLPTDLSVAAQRDALLAALDTEVDVLVNNAGFGLAGRYAELSAERELEMVRLNVEAPTHLCRALVPAMVDRGAGAVLNVGSLASFQPLPGMSSYAGTKAFTLSFTAGLHAELRGSGVSVTALCPGGTRTEFAAMAGAEGFAARLPGFMWMAPEDVAELAVVGLEQGRWLIVPGRLNRVFAVAGTHVPRRVLLSLAARGFGR